MERNILVATDFSSKSFDVINIANKFALDHKFNLHIVHIIEKGFFDKLDDETKIYENSFAHIKEKIPFIEKNNFHCKQDSLEEGIKNFVTELNASMVILGRSGERDSILQRFLGTSTKSIVRSINVPCIIVKADTKVIDFKSILIASDLSEESKEYIYTVHELFPKAKIELLHSYLVPFEGRLSFYGMDKEASAQFYENIRKIAFENTYSFFETINIPKEKIDVTIINEGLDPESFVAIAKQRQCELIALHTTGTFSFFAFDLLEHSEQNIMITKLG